MWPESMKRSAPGVGCAMPDVIFKQLAAAPGTADPLHGLIRRSALDAAYVEGHAVQGRFRWCCDKETLRSLLFRKSYRPATK